MNVIKQGWLTFKRKWLPLVVAYAGQGLFNLLMKTCTISARGHDHFLKAAESGKCILILWHNRLGPMVEFLKIYGPKFTYGALISKSRDGDLLAKLVNRYAPQGRAIRVAHNAKHQALRDVIQQLNSDENIIILITPDGPRGPRHKIKPGVVLAAKAAEAKIIPMTWTADRFWELNSWDKFCIPKPFAKIQVSFGEAVEIPQNDIESPEYHQELLERRMLDLESFCEGKRI